jgi:uncharacterized protein YecE (DUF72 family)
MTARLWAGTSGWMYGHWRGAFYPRDLPQSQWLQYYLQHFDTVELNNTHYIQPKPSSWEAWHDAAPDGFRYAVKAHRYLTHWKRFKDPEAPLDKQIKAAEALKTHLGPLLYQAPPNFQRSDANVERLENFLSLLPRRHCHALEFRHASWFGEDTQALLRRHNVAFCSYDMPGVECPLVATASFVYMRFHGATQKYRGNYTDRMLADWARRLKELSHDTDDIYVYFNNDLGGHAVKNAVRLREMLSE